MKQLLQDLRSHEVRLEEVPAPCCLPGGVLVRNVASLISSGTERATVALGSRSLLGMGLERPDLVRQLLRRVRTTGLADVIAAVKARLDAGVALGYSSAGDVLEVGAGAEEFAVGERVACAGADYASHAEVNWIPRNLCVRIPEGVDFESAAAVAVGGIALQGVRVAGVRVGERVAVIGLGLVGLLTAQILKAAGCAVWGMDLDLGRLALARELGVDFVCAPRAWRESPYREACERGEGPDAVIITAATPSREPIELAGRLARDRGVVVVVGDVRVDVPRDTYYRKELELRYSRSYGPGRYDSAYEEKGHDYPYGHVRWTERRNMAAFLDLAAAGQIRVSPLITHRFAIAEALQAYELLSGKTAEPYLGILITYPAPETSQLAMPKRVTLAPGPAKSLETGSGSAAAGGRVRVGWIGAGTFSRAKLLPALKKMTGVELAGVANSTGLSAQRAARAFGFRYAATDPEEILGDAAVDAVVIGTRHHLHAPLVVAALKRSKHVFVEKPLCLTEAELEEIAAAYAAAGSGRILMVGFNRRFSPFAREARRFLDSGSGPLSILYRVNAGPLPAGHWIYDPQEGGGRVISEFCHFVDFAQYLTDSVPVAVRAHAVRDDARSSQSAALEPPTRAENNVHAEIAFADGSRADILYLSSGDSSVPKERIEIFGRGHTAITDDFRKSWFHAQGRRRTQRLFRQDKGHAAELEAFIRAVASAGDPPIPFASLHSTTLSTFRIRESLLTGNELPVL
jgi:predicted dehydrogenase/threonine dehydrogenase-like Zn-dependent dehydrogenase